MPAYFEDLSAKNFEEIFSEFNENEKVNKAFYQNFKISFNIEPDNETVLPEKNIYFWEKQNQTSTCPQTKTLKFMAYPEICHKRDSLDNIIVKVNNKVIKSVGNYINKKIIKSGIKYLIIKNINSEMKKNLFKNKKDKLEFLSLTLKKFFLRNQQNEIIIREIEDKNHELTEILNMTFEEYFQIYNEKEISNDLKNENDQNYINKYLSYCKNPRGIINSIKERKPRKNSD